MTWNPSPKVADCREIARKWGVEQVIIFGINKDGELAMATYGANMTMCACSKKLGDVAFEAMQKFVDKTENQEIQPDNLYKFASRYAWLRQRFTQLLVTTGCVISRPCVITKIEVNEHLSECDAASADKAIDEAMQATSEQHGNAKG